MTPAGPTSPMLPDRDASDPAPLRDWIWLALAIGIALVPVWASHYFPTTDGGAHVANADVLLQYVRPAGDAYRKYYQLSHEPLPNSLGHFLLAAFMLVFPPLVAEKIFVSLYIVLLPLAVRYAVTAVRKSAAFLAILAVPLSLNWILHQGFYNFCCSVAIFFFAVGYWLRRREQMNAKRVAVLAVLGLLLYAGHLLSVVLGCAAILLLATWFIAEQWWQQRRVSPDAPLWPAVRASVIPTVLAILPAMALFLWFQRRGFTGKPAGLAIAIFNKAFWKNIVGFSILVSYRAHSERPFAVALAVIVLFLATCALVKRIRRRNWSRFDGLLLLPLAFTALYFTRGDEDSAKLFIPQRLIFYTYLTSLLFLAAQEYGAWIRRLIPAAAVVLVIGLTAVRWPAYREYNAQMSEFVGVAEKIEPGATLLPLVFAPRGLPVVSDLQGLRVSPFYTAAGYAAVDRRAIDLRNYEAGLDYFPVHFRADLNPYKHLAIVEKGKLNGLDDVPQRFDIAHYEQTTPGRVDYVLVWGITDEARTRPQAINTYEQLRAGYDLIDTSPSHRTELWRRKAR